MIETWKNIWERKGLENGGIEDLIKLDGYENTNINMKKVSDYITKELELKSTDNVLEIGCGAGALAQYLKCNYTGLDYSKNLVKKHIEILNNSVLVGEANNLIFKDKSFDVIICYGVFMYFENKKYADQSISEFKRVAKNKIFIGDLPMHSHRNEHLLFTNEEFKGWKITRGFYDPYKNQRFNAMLVL